MTTVLPATIIRKAEAQDAAAIAHVHVTAWQESYEGLLPAPMLAALSVPARARSWSTMLADLSAARLTEVLIAEQDGAVVGFAACGPQRDAGLAEAGFAAEIGSIYLLAQSKRQKLGTRLMASAFRSLAATGFEAASLWVLRDNSQARRFYESLGGQLIGEKEDRRGSTAIVEVAYGWRALSELS